MTVSELMEALQSYLATQRVVVLGYETGYDDITKVKEIPIMPVERGERYDGRFDDANQDAPGQVEQAVLVYGRNDEEWGVGSPFKRVEICVG